MAYTIIEYTTPKGITYYKMPVDASMNKDFTQYGNLCGSCKSQVSEKKFYYDNCIAHIKANLLTPVAVGERVVGMPTVRISGD